MGEIEIQYNQEQIDQTNRIADMCEDYSILSGPKLPKFECPNGLNQKEYTIELCNVGWDNKLKNISIKQEEKYRDRLNYELQTIFEFGLEGYFLIVQDYVNWAKNQGYLVGPARGSAAGSLVAYLLNITTIDPIKYNLIFERFINTGRFSKDRVSLPDIDMDFPIQARDKVIDYIKNKYGQDKVSHMCTFGGLQGKSALKEVLRVHEACDNATMNRMTKGIPDEGKISDKLEESQENSILRWTLKNDPKLLKDYCVIDEKDKLSGEYSIYFEQAIRLEGTYKSQGQHAAGIIISNEPLIDICPMMKDRTAFEMDSAESIGLLKVDVLGISSLDKLMKVNELLKYGKFK